MKKQDISVFAQKRAMLDIIEQLFRTLDSIREDNLKNYQMIGYSDVQKKNWKTKELMWKDEEKTIPVYEEIWDYVDIPEDELSEENLAKLKALETAKTALEKLL